MPTAPVVGAGGGGRKTVGGWGLSPVALAKGDLSPEASAKDDLSPEASAKGDTSNSHSANVPTDIVMRRIPLLMDFSLFIRACRISPV